MPDINSLRKTAQIRGIDWVGLSEDKLSERIAEASRIIPPRQTKKGQNKEKGNE